MQFLKNHYEKLILSLALLGLIGGVVVLFIQVDGVKSGIAKIEKDLGTPTSKPVSLRDRAEFVDALAKGTNPPPVALTGHRLFNPYRWVVDASGTLLKVDRDDLLGPGAMKVGAVNNLFFTITLVRVTGTENPTYLISTRRDVQDKAARNHSLRLNDKSKPFPYAETTATITVKEAKGEPANPAEVVLELEKPEELGGLTTVSLKPGEPYRELMSREADLQYPPENRVFSKVKVNDSLTLGGETYKVIAITDRQVIFEAQNKKRTIIDYTSSVPQ
jgi:hypothetical protein